MDVSLDQMFQRPTVEYIHVHMDIDKAVPILYSVYQPIFPQRHVYMHIFALAIEVLSLVHRVVPSSRGGVSGILAKTTEKWINRVVNVRTLKSPVSTVMT